MVRRTKKEIYQFERNAVLERIETILGISKSKPFIFHEDIDETKSIFIQSLIPDIKKYFRSGNWQYFRNSKSIMSLIKSVYHELDYKIQTLYLMDVSNKNIEKPIC